MHAVKPDTPLFVIGIVFVLLPASFAMLHPVLTIHPPHPFRHFHLKPCTLTRLTGLFDGDAGDFEYLPYKNKTSPRCTGTLTT